MSEPRSPDRRRKPLCSDCPFFERILDMSDDIAALKANSRWSTRLHVLTISILVLILLALVL